MVSMVNIKKKTRPAIAFMQHMFESSKISFGFFFFLVEGGGIYKRDYCNSQLLASFVSFLNDLVQCEAMCCLFLQPE